MLPLQLYVLACQAKGTRPTFDWHEAGVVGKRGFLAQPLTANLWPNQLGRLVHFLRSGMELEDATARLRESLMPDGEQGANPGRLAVLGEE